MAFWRGRVAKVSIGERLEWIEMNLCSIFRHYSGSAIVMELLQYEQRVFIEAHNVRSQGASLASATYNNALHTAYRKVGGCPLDMT
jgi:hypothetical protein